MAKVTAPVNNDLSVSWIFKAIVKAGGIVNANEQQYSGIAAVKADGQDVAIVSIEGKVEMSFSGQNACGRLTGQLGVAGFSVKGDGVALDDKISITYQSPTQSGAVQGNVVLQGTVSHLTHA